MKPYFHAKLVCAISLTASLAACGTSQPPEQPAPPPPPPPVLSRASSVDTIDVSKYDTAVERTLAEGLNFYDKGEYAEAIKKFQSPEFTNSWPELRIRALKYLAFSYCVTDDLRSCQQAFYDALQLDHNFTLLPSEEGHPIWGPVFEKAKLGPPAPLPGPVLARPSGRSASQRK